MKAAVVREHGGPDRLNFETDFPDPKPGEGDVIVAVKASSLNYHDVFTRRGMPGIKVPMPAIMGLDVAGEIAEVGPGVTRLEEGRPRAGRSDQPRRRRPDGRDRAWRPGRALPARAHQLIRIPDGVSFADAAALPVAYGTALRMMTTNGHVAKGEKVLILGASGGVGVCCLQLAKLAGAEVIACAGTDAKAKRLAELGADKTINYVETGLHEGDLRDVRQADAARRRHRPGVDVVVNYTGGDTWVKSLKVPEGRRPPADLRRHRGLRPEGGHPLHLDLRAEGAGLQRLGARRHRDSCSSWCRRASSRCWSTRSSSSRRRARRCASSRTAKCSARSWWRHERRRSSR